jgi:hypothetical protein
MYDTIVVIIVDLFIESVSKSFQKFQKTLQYPP